MEVVDVVGEEEMGGVFRWVVNDFQKLSRLEWFVCVSSVDIRERGETKSNIERRVCQCIILLYIDKVIYSISKKLIS